jgi:hypothetical protein
MWTTVDGLPFHLLPMNSAVVFVPLVVVGALIGAARQDSAELVHDVPCHRRGPLRRLGRSYGVFES